MTHLTTTDAATALGITPGRVRQLIRAGQLPAVKAGRDWLIYEDDVEAARRRKDGRRKEGRIMKIYRVVENAAGGAGAEVWCGGAESPEQAIDFAYDGITDEDCGDLSAADLKASAEAYVVEDD